MEVVLEWTNYRLLLLANDMSINNVECRKSFPSRFLSNIIYQTGCFYSEQASNKLLFYNNLSHIIRMGHDFNQASFVYHLGGQWITILSNSPYKKDTTEAGILSSNDSVTCYEVLRIKPLEPTY